MYFPFRPDLYQFAIDLRKCVRSQSPARKSLMFALGRAYGLTVKTMAGMARRSEAYVRRMLQPPVLPT